MTAEITRSVTLIFTPWLNKYKDVSNSNLATAVCLFTFVKMSADPILCS